MRSTLALLSGGASLAWAMLLTAAPYGVTHAADVPALAWVSGLTYFAGSFVCHQAAERSFHAWGVQLPVCARCFGLYAAAPVGALLAAVPSRLLFGPLWIERPAALRRLLVVAAVPTLVTVAVEGAGLAAVPAGVRAASAVPVAMVVAWLVAAAIRGHLK